MSTETLNIPMAVLLMSSQAWPGGAILLTGFLVLLVLLLGLNLMAWIVRARSLEGELKHRDKVGQDLQRMAIESGMGRGMELVPGKLMAVFENFFDSMISRGDRLVKPALEGAQSQFLLQQKREDIGKLVDKVNQQRTDLETLRFNYDTVLKQNKRLKEQLRAEKPRPNPVSTPQNPVETPSEPRSNPGATPVQPRLDPVETGFKLSLERQNPVIGGKLIDMSGRVGALSYIDDEKGEFYFNLEGYPVISVRRVRNDNELATFRENELPRGVAWRRGGRYILLCGLPSCNKVKFTQQPNARFCCQSHKNDFYLLENDQRLNRNIQ